MNEPTAPGSVEIRLCGKPCGEFVFSVKNFVHYAPPLREAASCGLTPDHEGPCVP